MKLSHIVNKSNDASGGLTRHHEGSININKGLYSVKDLGESLTHSYLIAYVDKKQLKKYKEIEKQNKEKEEEIRPKCI